MKATKNDHHNYDEELRSLYDEDEEEYYNNKLTDKDLDDCLYLLKRLGSKHSLDDIDDFLVSAIPAQLFELIKDLHDPKMQQFALQYVEKELDANYGVPAKATPPTQPEKTSISKSMNENENKEIPIDNKRYQIQEQKKATIFTKDLKQKFARAAFQLWRSATHPKQQPNILESTIVSSELKAEATKNVPQIKTKPQQKFS